jgi:hypothetical protein
MQRPAADRRRAAITWMRKLIEFFRKHPFADAGGLVLLFRAMDWLLSKAEHAEFIAAKYPDALKMVQAIRTVFSVSDLILWLSVSLGLGLIVWDIYFRKRPHSSYTLVAHGRPSLPTEMKPIICTDCKYFSQGLYEGLCGHARAINLSDGRQSMTRNVRADRDLCGIEAKWFVPK